MPRAEWLRRRCAARWRGRRPRCAGRCGVRRRSGTTSSRSCGPLCWRARSATKRLTAPHWRRTARARCCRVSCGGPRRGLQRRRRRRLSIPQPPRPLLRPRRTWSLTTRLLCRCLPPARPLPSPAEEVSAASVLAAAAAAAADTSLPRRRCRRTWLRCPPQRRQRRHGRGRLPRRVGRASEARRRWSAAAVAVLVLAEAEAEEEAEDPLQRSPQWPRKGWRPCGGARGLLCRRRSCTEEEEEQACRRRGSSISSSRSSSFHFCFRGCRARRRRSRRRRSFRCVEAKTERWTAVFCLISYPPPLPFAVSNNINNFGNKQPPPKKNNNAKQNFLDMTCPLPREKGSVLFFLSLYYTRRTRTHTHTHTPGFDTCCTPVHLDAAQLQINKP